jgi:hypothetical protein
VVKGVVGGGDAGLLALPVGLAVEHEFVGGGLEPVDGGLGEEGVGHVAEPLDGFWSSPGSPVTWGVVMGDHAAEPLRRVL